MTASIETIGNEAISAPKAGLRFAVSDTAATKRPEMAAFMAR
jgi:hypothetical protein